VGHQGRPSGRRAPATRPGALRDLVEEHLRKFPETAFTPHQVGKVLTRLVGAVANALDKLVSLGVAQMVTDKPRTYRLAAAPDAVGDPAASAVFALSLRGRPGVAAGRLPLPAALAAGRSRPGTSGR
jgi:hypothetical protein